MVGGGLKSFDKSEHQMVEKVSPDVMWFQNIVTEFKPEDNKVKLICGREIEYQQLVIALGLDLKWQNIDGLMPAFENRAVGVCSNYSAFTVEKTWENIQRIGSLAKDLQGGFAYMSRKWLKIAENGTFLQFAKNRRSARVSHITQTVRYDEKIWVATLPQLQFHPKLHPLVLLVIKLNFTVLLYPFYNNNKCVALCSVTF